ncbi:MAG: hypothetical protein EPO28_08805 [Saprospiraceae bacterium]|nr:MAG: hypothetical protein EPO28_08805 [Saprospiraceae bacterium]
MKLLLDENLPKKLKRNFPAHEVFTVREMKWDGKENGELLQLIQSNGFDVFLTGDKNIAFQQNFQNYPLPLLILDALDNTYLTLSKFAPLVEKAIQLGLPAGPTVLRLSE